ncbi:MAG TPA: hypothetical protein VLM37_05565 [Fibrobacteraceae bacterium]|nr:hypothetical protein [Fibrobacteraceae bacterium]
MPNGVKVHVLNVGQGMGNFIEVYGDGLDKPPTKTFIYDLGSEKGKATFGPPAIEFIINRLKAMATPRIDLITFSHGDKDHWNLFRDLIGECDEKLPDLQYGDVYFGGCKDQYDYGSSVYNVLGDLEKRKASIQGPFPDAASDFYQKIGSSWRCLANLDGLIVRLLLANVDEGIVLSDSSTYSEFSNKNSVSAVVVCEYADNRFILTGDATGLTISKINALIKQQGISDQVNNTFLMIVPHHGSAVTLKYEGDYAAAQTFATYCDANSIAASADFRIGFFHPDYAMLQIFCNPKLFVPMPLQIGTGGYTPPNTEANYPDHLYVAYNKSGWDTYKTQENIYTTQYSSSSPVGVWTFTVDESGAKTTERIPDEALAAISPLQTCIGTAREIARQQAYRGPSSSTPVNTSNMSPVYKVLRKKRAPGSDVGMYPPKQ